MSTATPATETQTAVNKLNVCIIGLGLIGGSFAKALKASEYTGNLTAFVRSEQKAQQAMSLGVVDHASTDLEEVLTDAHVVMLAVPMKSMLEQLQQLKLLIKEDTIITDAGSVKGAFISDVNMVFDKEALHRIVPGHPIAGLEKSGVEAAEATLYNGKQVLLTPLQESSDYALNVVTGLWTLAGAHVECLSPEHHDRVLAATSHLPHVLAFAIVDVLASRQEVEEIFRYSAGGLRDFTRIASGDVTMWRDICLTNQEAVCDALTELQHKLKDVQSAIERGDGDSIETLFERARSTRETHILNADKHRT